MRETAPLPIRRIEEHGLSPIDKSTWPATIPAVRHILDQGIDFSPLTIFVGENGAGKSTIVEAIAGAFGLNVEGGTHNAMHSTQVTESSLSEHLQLIRGAGGSKRGVFLRAETMHGQLAYLSEINHGRHNFQSHGESFIEFFTDRAGIQGLWIFDEAESALSFNGCLTLMAQVMELVARGSQVIISTHSPLLASIPEATLFELDATGIHQKSYDELQFVQDWRRFLDAPQRYIKHLS